LAAPSLFTVSFHGTRLFFTRKLFHVTVPQPCVHITNRESIFFFTKSSPAQSSQSICIRWLWNFTDDFLLYAVMYDKILEAGLHIILEKFYIGKRSWNEDVGIWTLCVICSFMFGSFGCINNSLFDKNLLKIFWWTDDLIPICGCNSLKVRFFYKILFAYYV
jgi:hypothetical protein